MIETVRIGVTAGLPWRVVRIAPEWASVPGISGMNSHWFCGYVRVPEGHPLHGLDYTDLAPGVLWDDIKDEEVGGRSIISPLCANPKAGALDILFDVHGSLNFANKFKDDDGWWFGFDCNHVDDSPEIQDAEYTSEETQKLAQQIANYYPVKEKNNDA